MKSKISRRNLSLQALREILMARITKCVSSLIEVLGRRFPLDLHRVACTGVNRVMLIILCAETIKPVLYVALPGHLVVDYCRHSLEPSALSSTSPLLHVPVYIFFF